jgi:hypothetical protein
MGLSHRLFRGRLLLPLASARLRPHPGRGNKGDRHRGGDNHWTLFSRLQMLHPTSLLYRASFVHTTHFPLPRFNLRPPHLRSHRSPLPRSKYHLRPLRSALPPFKLRPPHPPSPLLHSNIWMHGATEIQWGVRQAQSHHPPRPSLTISARRYPNKDTSTTTQPQLRSL